MAIILEKHEIVRDDSGEERVYKHKNKSGASVNKVLDYCEDKSFLYKWREKVGAEKAAEISQKASKDGSIVHAANEGKFTGETVEFQNSRQKQVAKQFEKFLNIVTEPCAHEYKIFWNAYIDEDGNRSDQPSETHKECCVGGTFDALLKVNTSNLVDVAGRKLFDNSESERYFIVDYKTQSKKKDVRWMLKHYVQAAAYIGALNQMTQKQYNINEALIVGATSRNLYIYYLDKKKINWYWRNWLKMVASYFHKTHFDWNSFKMFSEGFDLLDDGTWEFQGVPSSFLPIECSIDNV